MSNAIYWLLIYFGAINLTGFIIMGVDKLKAKKHAWRIPEATLFAIAVIGGSIGSILGMYTFRHKTQHKSFVYGMPAILIVQIALVLFLIFSPSISIDFL